MIFFRIMNLGKDVFINVVFIYFLKNFKVYKFLEKNSKFIL
jgi:hypothetical protein